MKKIKILFIMLLLFLIPNMFQVKAKDNVVDTADYLTYQEIIMSSGKLLRNYTYDELMELFERETKLVVNGLSFTFDNQNVPASYIASVQECMENLGNTDININVSMTFETNNKVSFTSNATMSSNGKGMINDYKTEIAAKVGVEYSKTTYQSLKETKTISLTVEAHSQYMVVITGALSISNGAFKLYLGDSLIYFDFFEIVVLQSQYARLEKREL